MISTLYEPLGLEAIDPSVEGCTSRLVDIIAVHGLCESSATAWIESRSKQNWLRQWLADDLKVARILTFDYASNAASFFESNSNDRVEQIAQTLVQNIHTHRNLEKGERRPIIFMCHGIGGIIVKKALIYSSTQTSLYVQHLYNVYVSTFALLFFGVPHHSLDQYMWLNLEATLAAQNNPPDESDPHKFSARKCGPETLRSIDGAFAPLTKQFRIFCFWEEVKTTINGVECFIVEPSSAVPVVDNIEGMGVPSDHINMIKFADRSSSAYRSVLASLIRHSRASPSIIEHRWRSADHHIGLARADDAYELTGWVYELEDPSSGRRPSSVSRRPADEHIHLPRKPDRDFVGRKDMANSLYHAFWRGNRAAQKIYVLYGMGGAGKTEIGIRFAKENQTRYSAIFTIDATDSDKINSSFANIGKWGGLEATEKSGKYWLERLEESWLLIIDNADDPTLNLPDLFPDCDHGHILVTTRNPHFRKHNNVGCTLVGRLEQSEALSLLFVSAQISGPPWKVAEQTAANKIVKALGCLALALKAAGSSIYGKLCSLYTYLDYHEYYLNEYRTRLVEKATLSEDEARTYAVFEISSQWLERNLSPENADAVQLMNIVAFFHFERIPIDIFLKAAENHDVSQSDSKGPSDIWSSILRPISLRLRPPRARPRFLQSNSGIKFRHHLNRMLARLSSLSIIFYDDEGITFSLHPLVHAWARSRLDYGERALWAKVAMNLITDSIVLPSGSSDGDHNIIYHRQVLPHLKACLKACPFAMDSSHTLGSKLQIILAPIVQPTLLVIMAEKILDLAKCGYVYLSCGNFEKSVEYLSSVSSELLHVAGPKNEKTMKAQLALAQAYWGLGRLEPAISIQQSVVRACKTKYGPSHSGTLSAMDHLARSYWLNGQYADALALQSDTVENMREVLPRRDHRLLEAIDNLGIIYGAWHRFEDSFIAHQQVLNIKLETSDPLSNEVVSTKMNLAMAMLGTGNYDDAQIQMNEVYEARKKSLGKEHPWTLWALCYLAKIKVKVRRLDEAEEMLTEGIAAGKRSLGDDHLGVLMGCGELARVYSRQGRLQEASELLEETVLGLEKSRGHEHPDHVYAVWKLGKLRVKQGETSDAACQYRKALKLAEARLTLDHPMSRLITADLNMLSDSDREMAYVADRSDGKAVIKDFSPSSG